MTPLSNLELVKNHSQVNGSYQGTASAVPNNSETSEVLTSAAHKAITPNILKVSSFLNFRGAIVYAAVLVLAAASLLVPFAHAQQTDHAKKLGLNLMCMCGCGQVLVQCKHLNCPSSGPMLKELDDRIATGESDELVIQDFIKGYGVAVLSSPPNTGFNRVAWLLPSVAFALGLGLVALVINHWRHRPLVVAAPQSSQVQISPDALARAREKVERETEE
jgi:cytochrome c-type biogenesis protein CcmH/NrfF